VYVKGAPATAKNSDEFFSSSWFCRTTSDIRRGLSKPRREEGRRKPTFDLKKKEVQMNPEDRRMAESSFSAERFR